jgi:hypothetical protein
MSRKKWTPKTEVNDSLLQFREKRKWQIALRRYVLEKQKCLAYAPFFGLDNKMFRQWIELQFDELLNWDNFSRAWQFDHIVPVAYFDFSNKEDLRLCWNFINIRVDKLDNARNKDNHIDVLAAKAYFEALLKETGYPLCSAMVEKITRIEQSQISSNKALEDFIIQNRGYLDAVRNFTAEDFERLNTGTSLKVLLSEKEFLKKFGG